MSSLTRTISRSKSRLGWEPKAWEKIALSAAEFLRKKAEKKEARVAAKLAIKNASIKPVKPKRARTKKINHCD
jgi:hypothetical protein